MGNAICTDVIPASFDEVKSIPRLANHHLLVAPTAPSILSQTPAQQPNGLTHSPVPPPQSSARTGRSSIRDTHRSGNSPTNVVVAAEHKQLFAPYNHNIKAWSFYWDKATCSVAPTPVKLDSNTAMDPNKSYLVLHLERVSVNSPPSSGDLSAQHAQVLKEASLLSWAMEASELLSPRGLKDPASVDIGNLRWRHSNDPWRYNFLIFVYPGKSADTLSTATAIARSFELELVLHRDHTAAEKLFYNLHSSAGCEPAPFPGLLLKQLNSRPPSVIPSRESLIPTLMEKNCLFRRLCGGLGALDGERGKFKVQEFTAKVAELKDAGPRPKPQSVPLHQGAEKTTSPVGESSDSAATTHLSPPSKEPIVSRVTVLPIPPISKLVMPSLAFANHVQHQGDQGQSPSTSPVPKLHQLPASRTPQAEPATPTPSSDTADITVPPLQYENSDDMSADVDDPELMVDDRAKRLREQSPLCTEILEWLFVGGETPAGNERLLVDCGITNVVNAAAIAIPNNFPKRFTYTSLYLGDSPDEDILWLFPVVNESIETARKAGGRTFIHCHQGVSRSCSFVIGYCMWKHGWCYDEAYKYVRARRTVCSPNSGFYVTLLHYQRRLAAPPPVSLFRFGPYRKEYPFPLVYSSVYPPRFHKAQNADGEPISSDVIVDPNFCYALLNTTEASNPQLLFLQSESAKSDLVEAAIQGLRIVLTYGFYTTPARRTSSTSKGDELVFIPQTMAQAAHKVISLTEFAKLHLQDSEDGKHTCALLAHSGAASPVIVLGEDAAARESCTREYEEKVLDFIRSSAEEADRRADPDTVEKAKGPVMTPGVTHPQIPNLSLLARTNVTGSPNGANQEVVVEDVVSPHQQNGVGSDAGSAGEADGDENILVDEGVEYDPLAVLPFPDLDCPMEIYDYSDLESDQSYLVVQRATRESSHGNRLWIWIGSESELNDADDLRQKLDEWRTSAMAELESPVGTAARVAKVVSEPLILLDGEEDDDFISMF